MYQAGLEHILGFRKEGDALIIDPCLPGKWREYAIHYRFVDTMYHITIQNPQGVRRGVARISVDGVLMAAGAVPLTDDHVTHQVAVTMGG
jgi:cyclic beta-1,2-glucan synthetase